MQVLMTSPTEQISALWGSTSPLTPPRPKKETTTNYGRRTRPRLTRPAGVPARSQRQPKRELPREAEDPEESEEEELLLDTAGAGHEFSIQMLEADRSFCLYLTTKESTLLPQMYKTSLKWKENYEAGTCDVPLRTALMGTMIMELQARLAKTSDDHLRKLCQEAGLLSQENAWRYLAWSPTEKKLTQTTKEPMPHTALQEVMGQILELTAIPGLIHAFTRSGPRARTTKQTQ
ncbi:unnamed protein product [Symbiodinium microadriaticum]|nr:unnamed protein product [Symbiodinium microadriaticum]